MFDIGFFELLVLSVIGLVILGPERLPKVARLLGAWLGKVKRALYDLREEVEQEVHAHELKERVKQELEKAGLSDLKEELEQKGKLLDNTTSTLKNQLKEPRKPHSDPSS